MDATDDIDFDLDPNFEPQARARSNTWPLRPCRDIESQGSPAASDETPPNDTVDQQYEQCKGNDPLGLTAKKSGSRRNAWGNLSYADLITKAIQSSNEKRLTLSQIYDWMVQNVPYFKDKGDSTSSAGWKNSIRHNLSLHSRFMRIQNEGTGKSSWWVINPDAKPGKTPRRRAGSMETKNFEKKRGRIRKKGEALRAAMENGALSPGVSEDYLDALSFGDFRSRASSNASSCGRLSPIHAMVEADLDDNKVPPMSPIPWGNEVNEQSNLYPVDNYSDLIHSLGDGMKLSSQDCLNMDVGSGLRDPYLSSNSLDYDNQSQNFLGVEAQSLDNQYSRLPAPPPYPEQQQQQAKPQLNSLEFKRPNFNSSGLRLQCSRSNQVSKGLSSFSQSDMYSDSVQEYNNGSVMIKQEPSDGLSPVHMGSANALSINTQHQLGSPDRSQETSPSSGGYAHLSPQSLMVNGQQSLSQCQISPQPSRILSPQLQPITTASIQQQLHQATQASILREALTRGPPTYRPQTVSSPTSTFSPLSPLTNLTPLITQNSNMNSGRMNAGLTLSPHHQLRSISENFADEQHANGNNGVPLDIDTDLISSLDYDMDQVIKQELFLEGSLDFNFDAGPNSAGQNVVH